MELRSLALGLSPELLGTERIPRATRIRTTKLNMTSMVKMSVVEDEDDFRYGRRECLGFAIGEDQIGNWKP